MGRGVHEGGERVDVGAFELGELAKFEDFADDGVVGGEGFEDVDGGGDGFAFAVADGGGEVQFFEEHFAKLLRRGDVEFAAGDRVDFGSEAGDAGLHEFGEACEFGGIDANAGLLHAGQDGGQGEVELFVDFEEAAALDFGAQAFIELVDEAG